MPTYNDPLQMFNPASAQVAQSTPLQQMTMPMMGFNSYRPDTVLSDDMAQNKLQSLWHRELENVASGGSRGDRFEEGVTKLFTQVIAPATAALGGDGTSQGANQFAQDMRQQMLDAKALKMRRHTEALTTLKALTDTINNTSPGSLKAMQAAGKLQQGNRTLDIKERQNTAVNEYRDKKLELQKSRDEAFKVFHENANKLGYAKLGFEQSKFKEQEQRIRQFEEARIKLIKRGQDIMQNYKAGDQEVRLQAIKADLEKVNAKLSADTNKFNAMLKLKASAVKVDPTTGQTIFVHQGANGEQVSIPAMGDDGVEMEVPGVDQYSDDPDLANTMKMLNMPEPDIQPVQEPQVSAPAAPVAPAAAPQATGEGSQKALALMDMYANAVKGGQMTPQMFEQKKASFLRAFPQFAGRY